MASYLWGVNYQSKTRFVIDGSDGGSERVQAYFVRPFIKTYFQNPIILVDTPRL